MADNNGGSILTVLGAVAVGAVIGLVSGVKCVQAVDRLNGILISKGLQQDPGLHIGFKELKLRRLLREHAPDLAAQYNRRMAACFVGVILAWIGILLIMPK